VLASRWIDLRNLARAFEYRDFVRLSAPTEELDIEHIGAIAKDRREEEFVEFPEPIEARPLIDGV
jgi:hypothetical protein